MTKPMNMILTFLAGTLAGLSCGFLFAPEKGATTRKTISGTARKMKTSVDKARRKLNQKIPVA